MSRRSLLEKATEELLSLAKSRLASFWAEAMPPIQAHWALIAAIAEVLLEADRVEKCAQESADFGSGPSESLRRWRLALVPARFAPPAHGKPLVQVRVRRRRRQPGETRQSKPTGDTRTSAPNSPSTSSVNSRRRSTRRRACCGRWSCSIPRSARRSQESKTAYVWVDALRFEMARELVEVLKEDFDLSLQPAIATMPTITEIGMASLLPKASQSSQGGFGRQRQARPGDRRDRRQGPKGSHQLHEGPRRGAGVRRQAGRSAPQAIEEGAGRHPERPTRAGDFPGD